METMEALLTRRSVRKYQPDPVPEADLKEILDAACHAPSAINLQHWYFVAIRDGEKLAELKELMRRVMGRFRPVLEDRFAKNPDKVGETDTFLTSLGGAPVCILAFFLKDGYPDRDGALQSTSAAIENLLLAAWDKGYGTCWISAPQRMGFGPEIQEKYAPGKGEFVAAVTLGVPGQSPKCPPRRDGRYDIL